LPRTLAAWQNAALNYHGKWLEAKIALDEVSPHVRTPAQRRVQWAMALGRNPPQSRPRQPHSDAMDVDAIRTTPLSPEEKKKFMAEGCCFNCQQQGHISRQCPHKKKKFQSNVKTPPQRTTARVIEEEEQESKVIDRETLKKGLWALLDKDKDYIMNEMISEQVKSATPDF
jgi:hypothetical protein